MAINFNVVVGKMFTVTPPMQPLKSKLLLGNRLYRLLDVLKDTHTYSNKINLELVAACHPTCFIYSAWTLWSMDVHAVNHKLMMTVIVQWMKEINVSLSPSTLLFFNGLPFTWWNRIGFEWFPHSCSVLNCWALWTQEGALYQSSACFYSASLAGWEFSMH